jgi:hypothetical protein
MDGGSVCLCVFLLYLVRVVNTRPPLGHTAHHRPIVWAGHHIPTKARRSPQKRRRWHIYRRYTHIASVMPASLPCYRMPCFLHLLSSSFGLGNVKIGLLFTIIIVLLVKIALFPHKHTHFCIMFGIRDKLTHFVWAQI